LEGETGTGKEVAARSIHQESDRRDGPFVVVDCGAVPPELLESELFGHQRGAFTGAVAARGGAFEAATGGTIFLDEIGELNSDLQPKLLRVLERREIKRVGSDHYNPVDVRVVAATNRNLQMEVTGKRFRSDLYYRLAVVTVRLPALRERLDDLPMLVANFLEHGEVYSEEECQWLLSSRFLGQLSHHAWPGNVRELRNYLERCLILKTEAEVPLTETVPSDLPVDSNRPLREARLQWNHICERRYVEQLLERHGGNVSAAARSAGVDRIHIHRLLRRYGIR
jgi:transcriptional regulator with GAF, ATPase, and Fis domain